MKHAWLTRTLCLLLPLFAACDGGTEPLTPSAFEVVAGDGQSATVGSALAIAPAVRVVTTSGKPVPGVDVTFAVTAGGGSIAAPVQKTGPDGVARAGAWTLGTAAGENTLMVSSQKITTSARLTAVAAADAPAALVLAVQPSGSASSGAPLPVQPVVRLIDRFGNPSPRPGVSITASAAGNVTLLNNTQQTDARGEAAFSQLTLRGSSAAYTLEFKATGLTDARAQATFLLSGMPHHLGLLTEPDSLSFKGQKLIPSPLVQLLDEDGNPVTGATVAVTATLVGAGATLLGTATQNAVNGRATFSGLSISDTGSYRIRFTAPGVADVTSRITRVVGAVNGSCAGDGAGAFKLNLALGVSVRRTTGDVDAPTCLEFDSATAAGHQYLVLFENMPLTGDYGSGVFPGGPVASSFDFAVTTLPAVFRPNAVLAQRSFPNLLSEPNAGAHAWDFGDGVVVHEAEVSPPAGGVPLPRLLRGAASVDLNAVAAHPVVGDTVQVYLEGISRLGISSGTQKAVVRYISDHLIIAEDIRLGTLTREGGTFNSPLSQDTMRVIAEEYAKYAVVQGDRLFEGRHNNAVETWGPTPKVLAVHTLMYANNIWGYTYSNGTYFAFDYWVGTNGSAGTLAQRAQRVADNLFMHEIAHMRHVGALERSGRSISVRGNRWLVEGFARFTERLPIANRLLGSIDPSRIGNIQLPRNTAFGNAYFYDDVPTYLNTGSSMFEGYGAAGYVFDYFMDQVAQLGGDPMVALRDFLLNAGSQATLDAAIGRWLPDVTFPELFTRARIALYADDYATGLPTWTQYLQYNLRLSRPPGSNAASDPRNAWIKLTPGLYEVLSPVELVPGSARGVLIDGTTPGVGSALIRLQTTRAPNGVVSITRVR